ncbi:hypothetical protein FAGKG844_1000004 [Frankia sp. AgKG'84/4]
MQEPAIKASQAVHQLKSGGYGLGCGAHPGWFSGELLNRFTYDRREATVKVCGVAVAMPQGQELGASSVDRLSIERGNRPASVRSSAVVVGGGIDASSVEGAGRGGGPVVVRGRESRPHGEGGQQARGEDAGMPGGRW